MAASELQSIVEARELLPAWIVWGSDALFVVAALFLSVPGVWLAVRFALRPLERASSPHWTERARLLYPARCSIQLGAVLFPTIAFLWGFVAPAPLSPLPRICLAGLVGLAIALLIVAFSCRVERRFGNSRLSFNGALRSVTAGLLVMAPHLLIAIAAAPFMPDELNALALVELAIVAAVGLLLTAGGTFSVIRLLGLSRDAPPRLQEICRRAAEPTGIRLRNVYEVDWGVVNALAFPVVQCLAFTPSCAARLTEDELVAVCGHELGHLRESKPILVARLVTAAIIVLLIASVRPVWGTYGPLGLLGVFVAYLFLCRWFGAFSRRMEARADAVACAGESNAGTYARALERIYELNLVPAVLHSRSLLHPDLYDRLTAAGSEPAYARPDPPPRSGTRWAIAWMCVPLMAGLALWGVTLTMIQEASPDDERVQKLALALQVDPAASLGNLGVIRLGQGKYSGAIVLLRAATDLDSKAWAHPMYLARAYLAAGGADDAAAAIATARQRHAQATTAALPVRQLESGVVSFNFSPAESRGAHLRDGDRLENLARLIDARRGVRLSRPELPRPAPIEPVPIKPAGVEPPRVEPAPEAGPQPDEGRPWRRRGRGRGRFRSNPPMASGKRESAEQANALCLHRPHSIIGGREDAGRGRRRNQRCRQPTHDSVTSP